MFYPKKLLIISTNFLITIFLFIVLIFQDKIDYSKPKYNKTKSNLKKLNINKNNLLQIQKSNITLHQNPRLPKMTFQSFLFKMLQFSNNFFWKVIIVFYGNFSWRLFKLIIISYIFNCCLVVLFNSL